MTSTWNDQAAPEEGEALLPATRRALLHRIACAQSQGRAPSVVASVVRGGRQVWSGARTSVNGHAPDDNVQYRIGSITKTFTAVLVLRLRDEGLLRLEDPLERHLPGTGVGERVTIAQLLSHTAGLAAETPGPWWERTAASLRPALGDVLGEQPFRHVPGRVHHYSNPGYALLGALVARLRGMPWEDALRREVLEPLGLRRTSVWGEAPSAGGWAVHPWADVLQPEKVEDLGVMAPAGQLWSTTGDLARFAGFLLYGDDKVLPPASVRELRTASAPGDWGGGYGLGTQLARRGRLSLAGHSGSVPGFVAGLWVCEEEDVAAVVLANCTSGLPASSVAAELLELVADAEPVMPEPWRPLPDVDQELLALTGPWYWGTHPLVLRLAAGGDFELGSANGGGGRRSRFRAQEDGTWVGLDGYYNGEPLQVVRDTEGRVSHLDLGSFVLSRAPYEEEVTPGGTDPQGWQGLSV